MEWGRIFKRKRWLFNIPTIAWSIIWEFTKDTIFEGMRNYLVGRGGVMAIPDYLLQHPIVIAVIVVGGIFLWAYNDTKKEKQNYLKIICKKANAYMTAAANLIGGTDYFDKIFHKWFVDVSMQFIPTGEIKMESLKLHIGKDQYDAKELPVIVIDRDETYTVRFSVPEYVAKQVVNSKGKSNYIRVIGDNRDWRSDNFSIE